MTKYSGGRNYQWQIPPHEVPPLYSGNCYSYANVRAQRGPNYGAPMPTLNNTEYKIDLDRIRYVGHYIRSSGPPNDQTHHFWDDRFHEYVNVQANGNYFLDTYCHDETEDETEFSDSDYGGKKNRKSKRRKSLSKRRKSLKKKQRKTKRKSRR